MSSDFMRDGWDFVSVSRRGGCRAKTLGLTECFKGSERFLGSMGLNFVTDMRLSLQRKALITSN